MACRPSSATLALILVMASTASASALSLPFEESDILPPEDTTTYVERSLNHQAPLTIEHPPTVRHGGRAAMAGFCRDGGMIRRRDEMGRPIIVRQREICENVAPRQLWPGHVDPRPAWPVRSIHRPPVLATKG